MNNIGSETLRMSSLDGSMVALSFFLGFVGAYSAINLADLFRLCKREVPKLLTPRAFMLFMAISVGGVAMWSMHFVAMSANKFYTPNGIPVEIRYRIDYTLISLVVVVVLCYIGIYICSKDKAFMEEKSDVLEEFVRSTTVMSIRELKNMKSANYVLYVALFRSLHRIVSGGIITATGVCVMHFIGMTAIVTEGRIQWDQGIICSSVVIALVASVAGYWILFRLIPLYPRREILRLASALVIATAVTSMHYSGSAAATFIYVEGASELVSKSQTINETTAVFGSLAASIIFICIISLVTTADLRAWYYNKNDKILKTEKMLIPLLRNEHGAFKLEDAFNAYKNLHPSCSALQRSQYCSEKVTVDFCDGQNASKSTSRKTSQKNTYLMRSSAANPFDNTLENHRQASVLHHNSAHVHPEHINPGLRPIASIAELPSE